jgi:hypothetical protein
MQTNLENVFPPDRLIYSFQKALDETLALGVNPRRLFRVLYPIRVIEVVGRQRLAVDMEEILGFLERGIYEAGLKTVEELQIFFGLDPVSVGKLIGFLIKIGHILDTGKELVLTELGVSSVKDSFCYQEQETSFSLYFEGFGNHPLSQEHFRIKMCEDVSEEMGFVVFPPLFRNWDPKALQDLRQRDDRSRYGLFEEVTIIQSCQETSIVYMPVYIVERMMDAADLPDMPPYLAFSTIPGFRDRELEQAINQDPMIHGLLENASRDMGEALAKRLASLGIKEESYYVKPHGNLGVEVVLDGAIFTGDLSSNIPDAEKTLRQVGKYLLASEWCFWLTCDDLHARREAGIWDCLEWLDRSHATPTREAVNSFISTVNKRLNLSDGITIQVLQDEARKKIFSKALDRLAG